MRDVPAQMTRAWRSGNYTGDQMPRVRCVVGRPHMTLHRYTFPKAALPLTTTSGVRNIVAQTPGSGGLAGIGISQRIRDGVLPSSGTTTNTFASFLFNDDIPQEIANVKSVSWDRGIDQDVGSCTIELYNIHPRHPGEQFQGGDPWRTGWFSWNYGKVPTLTQRYGQLTSEAWYWAFVPDNWIKTFEGYGADYSLTPEDDPHMVQTGIWKIKDVTLSAAGLTVKITAEDYGSLLTEQIVAEPVVPKDWLPLTFGPIPGPVTATSDLVNEGSPIKLSITKTSNLPWNGDGPMYGHSPHHGMDGNHSCVDDQTEIFTQRGWLKHDEIREGDMTLGIDHQTWKARWDRIGEVQRYDHDGDLIRIKFRHHDSLTTPNHNWPTRRRQRGKATSGGYLHEMRRTDELACEDAIPLAADVTNLPTVETYSNAFVEVVAWFCTKMIHWHFSPREVQKVAPGGLVEYDFLNQLTKDQLDLYLDVCIKADGSRTGNQVKFAAEHESEIRRFEHAALLAGHGVSTTKETRTGGAFIKPGRSSEIWICYLLQQGPIHPKSRRETERFSNEHYKGVIWCPTTATGTWLMRRNGKVSFTGNSYWLSVGNESPSRGFAYEYMEFSTGGKVHLGQVKFSTVKAGYVAYLSISIDGGHTWLTKGQVIGWNSESIGRNGGNIPYSQTMSVPNENTQTFLVNEHNVTHFRITLGNLQDFGLGSYRYRGAFREVSATTARSVSQDSVTYRTHPDDATAAQYPGVMSDITDIVKLCLAWAGFFWPENARTALCNTRQDPQRRRWRNTAWKQGDPFFGKRGWAGRVWADLEQTGTTMPAGLKDLSHNTLMECVVGRTLVRSDRGLVSIDKIRLGDKVANRKGWGQVIGVKSSGTNELYEVWIAGERHLVTAGHLFETTRGWVRADALRPAGGQVGGSSGDGLSDLPDEVYLQESLDWVQGDVFQELQPVPLLESAVEGRQVDAQRVSDLPGDVCRPEGSSSSILLDTVFVQGVGEEEKEAPRPRLRHLWEDVSTGLVDEQILLDTVLQSGEEALPVTHLHGVRSDLRSEGSGATALLLQGVSSQTEIHSGRAVGGSIPVVAGAGDGSMASGVLDFSAGSDSREGEVLSGSGEDRLEDRHRGGRPASRMERRGGRGSGRVAGVARVDRIEVYRRGDSDWASISGGEGPCRVYDISVEGDPSFLIGNTGAVVHNCISRCREVCGFVFWVDETGAPIWRLPNLYSRGNWVGTLSQQPRRTQDIVTVDERVQLVDIDVRLSGRNTREEVQVGSPDGKVGAKVKGWLANPVGLRRSAIYADQNFKSDREAQVMADMIALRQMYSYREDTLTIPGYPGIQIDDQIRVIERSTVEAFLHYVKSVSMTWDQESGEYFYTLQTHWLGSDPKGTWVLRPEELTPPTRALIDRRVEDMRRSWESPTMGTIRRPQPPLIIWEKLK